MVGILKIFKKQFPVIMRITFGIKLIPKGSSCTNIFVN